MKQLFSDIGEQVAPNCYLWKRENKKGELYNHSGFSPENTFQATSQQRDLKPSTWSHTELSQLRVQGG
jgi:hypothetical protein